MNPSEAKDGLLVVFLVLSPYQSPHMELILAGNNLAVGFRQVPNTNLLVSTDLNEDLEERLDAVGTISKDGVAKAIAVDTSVANDTH